MLHDRRLPLNTTGLLSFFEDNNVNNTYGATLLLPQDRVLLKLAQAYVSFFFRFQITGKIRWD